MIKAIRKLILTYQAKKDPLYWTKKPLPYNTTKQVKRAKKLAIKAHEKTGQQWHIMPIGNMAIIINNEWRKIYNSLKGTRKVNILDLCKMAYYSTPSKRSL